MTHHPLKYKTKLMLVVATLAILNMAVTSWQAIRSSPVTDELAHLAAGIAIIQTGDPGYYRVNPPIHKLISAIPVAIVHRSIVGPSFNASVVPSGDRREATLAVQFLEENPNRYGTMLIVGRLVRLPIVIFVSIFCFLRLFGMEVGAIASGLWLTSPLILGHGWAITPDAMSGVAATLVLTAVLLDLRAARWVCKR